MSDAFEDLQQSYGRCLRNRQFIERFYEVFLASNPSIARMFEKTDFQQQRLALRRGISVAIAHAGGSSMVKRTMDQMADVHSRAGRTPVPPALYPHWIESLMTVVGEMDPEATPALLARWRTAMGRVVESFSRQY